MIKQSVPLGFDPETSNDVIKKIFADDLARTLWLAIKQSHLVDPHFDKFILKHTESIKTLIREGNLTAEVLFRLLSSYGKSPTHCVIGPEEEVFATELLPFVKDEKKIEFVVRV